MKKNIYSIGILFLFSGITFYTGCKKDDTTPPVVTLKGNASDNSVLNTAYSDPGATASDDEDGDISSSIVVSGTVNKDLKGSYTLTYTATDAAGNVGTATRTVNVKNDVDAMTGTYTCTIAGSPNYVYTQTITASTTLNKRILFSKFGDYSGNTNIYANVTGTTVDLPSQTAVQVGNPATDRTFAGTGTTNSTGFSLSYTETTSGGTINTNETFVKQ